MSFLCISVSLYLCASLSMCLCVSMCLYVSQCLAVSMCLCVFFSSHLKGCTRTTKANMIISNIDYMPPSSSPQGLYSYYQGQHYHF